MSQITIFEWMSEIDPVLIARADAPVVIKRRSRMRSILIIAATLALLMLALTLSAAFMLDSYVEQRYENYDGTILHALDIVLTQDDNAIANALGESNRASLHTLFNALRGIKTEPDPQPDSETEPYSEGLSFTQYSDGTYFVSDLGECKDSVVRIPPCTPNGDVVAGIQNRAFENEIGITSVILPDTVTTIESAAFAGCSRLESVTLSNRLKVIEAEAFRSCWRLTALHIPASVTGIGQNVVGMCIMLQELTVDEHNPVYRSQENCLIEIESGALIAGCETSVIPEGISRIAPYAFFCIAGLRSVEIPEGVTGIGDKAFLGCSGLREVTFPSTLERIGEQAFSECVALHSVVLPEGLPAIESRAFEKSGIASISLPSTVQTIQEGVFAECTALVEIDLPEGLMVIEENLFYGCSKLERVGIPDSVTKIMHRAFYQCEALAEIDLPPSLGAIGEYAFFCCRSLTSVTLPEGLFEIAEGAFCNCNGMTELNIPSTLGIIPYRAFDYCPSLESVTLPEGVFYIEECAFYQCTGLKSFYIPSSVIGVSPLAFYSCNLLSKLTVSEENSHFKVVGNCLINTDTDTLVYANARSEIPGGIREIGNYALSNTNFRRITFRDGVEVIGNYACSQCWDMVSVVIPAGVTTIEDGAFDSCINLRNVYYTGTEEEWAQIEIGEGNEDLLDATIHYEYVPEDAMDTNGS